MKNVVWSSKNNHLEHEYAKFSNKKVWWTCLKDKSHVFEACIAKINTGQGCPYCSGRKVNESNCLSTTHPSLSKEWHPSKNKETPKQVTAGSGKKVWWMCEKGHEWQVAICYRSGSRKTGCPYCREYKGEKVIAQHLTKRNICFQRQFAIDGCFNKSKLYFDFAVFREKEIHLIEYNGIQHYRPVEFFGGQKGYEYIKKNDNIKIDFCQKQNYPLLIIPYTKFKNINTILEEYFE